MPPLPPPAQTDICVVGGGIVGLATARELAQRHPDAEIALLERETELATHQSGHSSGVIHAGIYYQPGSLKARLCVEGARRLYEYCAERGIDARRDGKVIVATDAEELRRLAELERRGKANGVRGLERIGPDALRRIEPHAAGLAALHSPNTGVVDFPTVARAYADDFVSGGGRIHTGCEVTGFAARGGGTAIDHASGTTLAAKVVVCAGPWADRLAVEAGAESDPRIVPFRGAYLRLKPSSNHLVHANIYPVPDPELPFLGMHLTRSPSGEVLLGPTALFV
ncbi:MAG: L-2-hydroxyglutarate oxidase, partial [Solirubrobacterales bacterium]